MRIRFKFGNHCFTLAGLLLLFSNPRAGANPLRASLAHLPVHSQFDAQGKPQGGFVDLVRAIDAVYPAANIGISIYPFSRSLDNVVTGQADFHLPLIRLPHLPETTLPFAYVPERITQVSFVFYSNADKPPPDMSKPAQYHIATMLGHDSFFTFKIEEISSIETAVKLVAAGRIDGFIMEQDAVDKIIRQQKVANIRRTLYKTMDSCIVVAKSSKGRAISKIIGKALQNLKKSGKLAQINATIHQPYNPWQPSDMHW